MAKVKRADGSSVEDRRETIQINRSDDIDRMRFRCPNGHTRWTPTNSHVYCSSCGKARDSHRDADPEHYELLDKKTGELISWSRIELIDGR
ncbi:hypothetical protein SAMN06269185_3308 [Natronoarchaeum philippinense]|uniref:Uncharacterized protein n=1 Tax=Natronoarchaeum philippinense TaxID=558529 RepID=A0A285P921_NATPI|nr:hypothetical protein [Natronoarchaeum philippinense]SNZ18249.1 hypothetical protein SAMN06269185_3308 [Natronoarchaeum philippinense]